MTLLEITQSVLASLDSDNVDDIAETLEAVQVALIVKEAYFDLVARREWGWLRDEFQLVGLGLTAYPTKMQIPANVNKIHWIKYNKKDIIYLTPKDFRDMIDLRDITDANVNADGFITDRFPTYWTSFDDDFVWFDSYEYPTEDTLTSAYSKAYGVLVPVWDHTNTFVPDMPEKYFPTLLAESKSQAFVNLKQQANAREEQKAKRGTTIMQNEHWKNKLSEAKFNSYVNYGRK
jgi:hypothetical protein